MGNCIAFQYTHSKTSDDRDVHTCHIWAQKGFRDEDRNIKGDGTEDGNCSVLRPDIYYKTQQVLAATPDVSPDLAGVYNSIFYNKLYHIQETVSQMSEEKQAAFKACAHGEGQGM